MYYANTDRNMFILPGRLRIQIKGLKGNTDLADRINSALSARKGITKVTANPYTGNALVFFGRMQSAFHPLKKPSMKQVKKRKRKEVPISVMSGKAY